MFILNIMPKIARLFIAFILFTAFYVRFFNLMHDSPYFFDPDERNMASAVTQFRLPAKIIEIPRCLISEFSAVRLSLSERAKRNNPDNLGNLKNPDCALNPHFFAYGQFPLYISFISDQLTKPALSRFSKDPDDINTKTYLETDFTHAVYWLRFYSAAASVGTVWIIFLIASEFVSLPFSIFAAAFTALTPGLIQSAHFGTTESVLTFFFMATIYLSLKLQALITIKKLFLLSLSIGLAIGSKLTGIFFLFPPFFILLIKLISSAYVIKSRRSGIPQKAGKWPVFILGLTVPAVKLFKYTLSVILISLMTYIIYSLSSPYNFVEPENFHSAVFGYESDVATGKFEAFYTRQFFGTKPLTYQLEKIFPYVLGWPLYIAGVLGLIVVFLKIFIKRKKTDSSPYLLLFASFFVFLIPNALLFAKWSRFMAPLLPFFAVFAAILLNFLWSFRAKSEKSNPLEAGVNIKKIRFAGFLSRLSFLRNDNKFFYILITCFLILAFTPGVAFLSVYENEDTRLTASKWIYDNLPDKSYVLSETANVIDIPLGIEDWKMQNPGYALTVISFDFYHLNEREELYNDLINHLAKSEYIFIPSRRIFKNHILQPDKFKTVNKYYELLFSGKLGFAKVAEFSSFPQLNLGPLTLKFPDEEAEETYTVFDHPVIRIYKKVKPYNPSDYDLMFKDEQ